MNKEDIIDRLMIDYEVIKCVYPRNQLETLTKKELLEWLRALEELND